MSPSPDRFRTAVGVMTGTSLDAVDVAVASIEGTGLDMTVSLSRHGSLALGPIADRLREVTAGRALSARGFSELAADLGDHYVQAIKHVAGSDEAFHLIAVHGQTVYHGPPLSWQLMNPSSIAVRFGAPVVCDLRQVDIACGGQGAPITPLADWVLFRDADRPRVIVNLGGFCNVTVLRAGGRPDDLEAFDVCVCNQVLDAVARATLGRPYDDRGSAATRGSAEHEAVTELRSILDQQRLAGRSLGTDDEATAWSSWLDRHSARLVPDDLAASATAAVAATIAAAIHDHDPGQVIVAGGGAQNEAVLANLRSSIAAEFLLADDLGVPVQFREALAMAVLGALAWDGVPVTVPAVTGATRALAGGLWWLPGGPTSGSMRPVGR